MQNGDATVLANSMVNHTIVANGIPPASKDRNDRLMTVIHGIEKAIRADKVRGTV